MILIKTTISIMKLGMNTLHIIILSKLHSKLTIKDTEHNNTQHK
jgi:hypothetical protein